MRRTSLLRAERERSIHLTYPGNYSPVEAGQLGVVVGNLLFDDPGGGQKDGLRDRTDGLSNQENIRKGWGVGGEGESGVRGVGRVTVLHRLHYH